MFCVWILLLVPDVITHVDHLVELQPQSAESLSSVRRRERSQPFYTYLVITLMLLISTPPPPVSLILLQSPFWL